MIFSLPPDFFFRTFHLRYARALIFFPQHWLLCHLIMSLQGNIHLGLKMRLLFDRHSLVLVPNAPRRRARADDRYYEGNIMESYFHPEFDHHIGSGP